MAKPNIEDIYPLSPLQQGMLFHCLQEPHSALYWSQYVRELSGPLDKAALRRAWQMVIARHGALRTAFVWENREQPLQVVLGEVELDWLELDLCALDGVAQGQAVDEYLARDQRRGYDLVKAPLHRLALVSLAADRHQLIWSQHHLLIDGWSSQVVLKEVMQCYASLLRGETVRLPPPRPFKDYVGWMKRQPVAEAEPIWRQSLQGFRAPTPLPGARVDSGDGSREPVNYAVSNIRLSTQLTATLRAVARQHRLTLNTLVQGAWAVLISRYASESDVVFGMTVSGRTSDLPGIESMVGLLINTLPCRVQVDPEMPALQWLQQLQDRQIDLRRFEHVPLVQVQRWSDVPAGHRLFDSLVVFENFPVDDLLRDRVGGLRLGDVRVFERGSFPLTAVAHPEAELLLQLSYQSHRFSSAAIQRMLGHWGRLLESFAADVSATIGSMQMLTEPELSEILARRPVASFPSNECLHSRFERQAARTPDAIAVTCDEQSLTYRELDVRANRLARQLLSLGVVADQLVGLRMNRGIDLIVGIVGILKSGAAYLPLDPMYPRERTAFMLEDSRASVVVTQQELGADLQGLPVTPVLIEQLSPSDAGAPVVAATPDSLAYAIYTSGSTGKPKGVQITHRNVIRLFDATDAWFRFSDRDVWSLFHSYSFDFSVWEIWGALLYGGRLVVVPFVTSRSPEAFYALLSRERVTVLNQTPSAFRQLIAAEETAGQKDLALRYVIFGGEALDLQSLRPWFERHGETAPQLVNMYGITETTVHVTYRPIGMRDLGVASVIGEPIPDLQLYILDARRQPVPIGVPGEIYVAGAGLARGYLNRDELTAERFVPDTLSGMPGSRLYRTGDLARFLPGWDVEYLGRVDQQVKIRGFRIELGEIESVLTQYPAVREAVAMVREDAPGDKRLVAYVTCAGVPPDVAELRNHLKKQLPEHMIPAAFVFLDKLPLTVNGKADRKALPAPDARRLDTQAKYLAPRNEVEEILAGIWAKVLRVPRVGVHDNFYELGGDSILTIQIIALSRKAGLTINLRQLLDNQTVADLAAVAARAQSAAAAERAVVHSDAPLIPIQGWFFDQSLQDAHHFNQAFLFTVNERLDASALRTAVAMIESQHEALRLRFTADSTGRVHRQTVAAAAPIAPVTLLDFSALDQQSLPAAIERACQDAQASLDIAQGSLWRVLYMDLGPSRPGRLFIAVHHLAIDIVSWRILMEDLEVAYRAAAAGRTAEIAAPTTSYLQWAHLHHSERSQALAAADLDHWMEVLSWAADPLPIDSTAGENRQATTRVVRKRLSAAQTTALLQRAPLAYNTQINDLLMSAMAPVLQRWTGKEKVSLALEGHGREDLLEADVSRTIGWFTTIYPVALSVPTDIRTRVKSIKEQLRAVPNRGLTYGLCRHVLADRRIRCMSEPQLLFNYVGQFDQLGTDARLFGPAQENSGAVHSPRQVRGQLLAVDAMVIDGQLEVAWSFGTERHLPETIEALANDYSNSLQEVIEHCVSANVREYTPADFPLCKLSQAAVDRLSQTVAQLADVYALAPIQSLFYTAASSGVPVLDHWSCVLDGDLEVQAFRAAWDRVIDHHPILRSSFHSEQLQEPVQVVSRTGVASWDVEDWRNLSADVANERWDEILRADRARGMDLAVAPLMRFKLVRTAEQRWRFLWSVPALLLDGWSWPLVFRDLSNAYGAIVRNQPAVLEPARPYRDYVAWLRQQQPAAAKEYWSRSLAGFRQPTRLVAEAVTGAQDEQRFQQRSFVLDAPLVELLQKTARTLQITPNVLIQAAWALTLARLSGDSDVLFGAAVAGRPSELPGSDSIVGPFVNNLPVRVSVLQEQRAVELLKTLHRTLGDISHHQHTPLAEVQSWSEVPWRERLFESLVVFQNYTVDEAARSLGASIALRDFAGPVHSNYPLLLVVAPGAQWVLSLLFDGRRLPQSAVHRWGDDMLQALRALTLGDDLKVGEIVSTLSTPVDRQAYRASLARLHAVVAPQGDMEARIAAVWSELLQLDDVSVTENLFDLGVHSLLIAKLHQRLLEALGVQFSLIRMFEFPTIRALAAYLAAGEGNDQQKQLNAQNRGQRQRDALAKMKRSRTGN